MERRNEPDTFALPLKKTLHYWVKLHYFGQNNDIIDMKNILFKEVFIHEFFRQRYFRKTPDHRRYPKFDQ